MTNNYLLKVENVHAGYIKDVDILQGINFHVTNGELVTVIGPNGAGKSTLIKTIFGLLTPHTGKITFKNQNLVGLKSNQIVEKGMSYVPQIANVFPSLTVDENLEMGAFVRNIPLKPLKDKIYNMFPRLSDRLRQFEQIKEINRSGTAIVLVEQNARKALEMADRGYVLESGKDAISGPGRELLHDPKVGELYLGAGKRH